MIQNHFWDDADDLLIIYKTCAHMLKHIISELYYSSGDAESSEKGEKSANLNRTLKVLSELVMKVIMVQR